MKIGMQELLIVFIVALVVIGPDKLPEYAKKLGQALGTFRKYTNEATKGIQESLVEPLNEAQKPLREAMEPVAELEKEVNKNVNDIKKSFSDIGRPAKASGETAASGAAASAAEEAPAETADVPEETSFKATETTEAPGPAARESSGSAAEQA